MLNKLKNGIVAVVTTSLLAVGLSGCLLGPDGEEESSDEYGTETNALKVSNSANNAQLKKAPVNKAYAHAGPGADLDVGDTEILDWTSSGGEISEMKIGTSICSNSWGAATACNATNGTTGQINVPGPDGGTCTYDGSFSNCSMKSNGSGKCCVCDFNVTKKSGDCKDDGSTTSFGEFMPETY